MVNKKYIFFLNIVYVVRVYEYTYIHTSNERKKLSSCLVGWLSD